MTYLAIIKGWAIKAIGLNVTGIALREVQDPLSLVISSFASHTLFCLAHLGVCVEPLA